MRVALRLAVGIAAGLCCALGGAALNPLRAAALAPAGPVEAVFVWTRDRCAADDIPDAPLRAVRLQPAGVVAFSTHFINRRFVGSDLNAIARDCAVVFAGEGSSDPADYSDRVWIAATWSEDGRTIFALGHDEYQAHRHPGRCRLASYSACWYNAVVALRSDDGGRTFARVGDRPIAVAPVRQDVDQGRPRGFFEPTNIVKRSGAYYALIRAEADGEQKTGTCLFRADDLSRPESWRFFDGEGFSPSLDPYRDDLRNAKPCAPLKGLRGNVGSIVYAPAMGVYVAVSAFGSRPEESGFYYSVSSDLIHWSAGRLFLALPTLWSTACGQDRFGYPSLVDPASPARNFDVIGDLPTLYLVRRHFDGCQGAMERDLVRIPLRLSPM